MGGLVGDLHGELHPAPVDDQQALLEQRPLLHREELGQGDEVAGEFQQPTLVEHQLLEVVELLDLIGHRLVLGGQGLEPFGHGAVGKGHQVGRIGVVGDARGLTVPPAGEGRDAGLEGGPVGLAQLGEGALPLQQAGTVGLGQQLEVRQVVGVQGAVETQQAIGHRAGHRRRRQPGGDGGGVVDVQGGELFGGGLQALGGARLQCHQRALAVELVHLGAETGQQLGRRGRVFAQGEDAVGLVGGPRLPGRKAARARHITVHIGRRSAHVATQVGAAARAADDAFQRGLLFRVFDLAWGHDPVAIGEGAGIGVAELADLGQGDLVLAAAAQLVEEQHGERLCRLGVSVVAIQIAQAQRLGRIGQRAPIRHALPIPLAGIPQVVEADPAILVGVHGGQEGRVAVELRDGGRGGRPPGLVQTVDALEVFRTSKVEVEDAAIVSVGCCGHGMPLGYWDLFAAGDPSRLALPRAHIHPPVTVAYWRPARPQWGQVAAPAPSTRCTS